MSDFKEQFLFLLKTALNDEKLPDGFNFDVDRVFVLAQKHNVLPLIFEKAAESGTDVSAYKHKVLRLCGMQINKNLQFEEVCKRMAENSLFPLVVKGPVCADTYRNANYRLSSDFDIVFPENDSEKYSEFFDNNGFVKNGCSYKSENGSLYIEFSHKLGEGDDDFARNADTVFDGFYDRTEIVNVYKTLSYNEHLVYLIYHAFKHFIGSGFGVKQLCDIYMYIKKYSDILDFVNILSMLDKIGIRTFADNCFCAISRIFEYDVNTLVGQFDFSHICYDEFVDDLLEAGVFGKSSEDRLHSASVVHNAVASDGKKSLVKTLFPSLVYMKSRYEILGKLPFLLPLFWLVRFVAYVAGSLFGKKKTSPLKSLNIAEERLELMRKMGIL